MSPAFVFLFVSFLAVADCDCSVSDLKNCMQDIVSNSSSPFCQRANAAVNCSITLKDRCRATVDSSFLETFDEYNIPRYSQFVQNYCNASTYSE